MEVDGHSAKLRLSVMLLLLWLLSSGCGSDLDCPAGYVLVGGTCAVMDTAAGADAPSPDQDTYVAVEVDDVAVHDEGPGPPDTADSHIDELAPDVTKQDSQPDDTTPQDTALQDTTFDTDTGCAPPFEPDSPTESWEHTSTSLLVVSQGSANHRGQDVVVNPGQPQILIGKFAYGVFDKDLKDEKVEIWIRTEECGPYVKFGTERTSEDGEYGSQYGIEDDGGRIFFTIQAEAQLGLGTYPVKMLVKGDHSEANFNLFVVPAQTHAVVFDIDGTLTTGDFELFMELISDVFSGAYVPEMYEDADVVVNLYADKNYLLVYLTGRPDMLKRHSVEWLAARGFVQGVMHLTDTNSQVLPTESGVQAYKAAYLQHLMQDAHLIIDYAYGNATTDIGAYEAVQIPKERTFIIGDHGGENGTQAISDYPSHLPYVQSVPPAVQP